MTNYQTLKGFRDFLGRDAKKRQWLIETIQTVFERYGFERLETPTLEYEALLMGKYGAEADKLVYGFEDKGGRRVALRYDQTIPTARVVSQYQNQLTFPYRRYQIQPVWRADKPQKGRYREFFQCDADIVGSSSQLSDAEILAVYVAIYREIGLTSIKVKINDRQTLIKTITECGIEEKNIFSVIQTIDKLDKKSTDDVINELEQKGMDKNKATELLSQLRNAELPSAITNIIELTSQLGVQKEVFEYTPTLARGLDYYTGMIFEGYIPEYSVGSVGGGGRYDNLLNDLVGLQMPAVGFGLGFDRTLEAAETLGKIPDFATAAQVLVTIFSPELVTASTAITQKLRSQKINVEIYTEKERSVDKQLKYANKKGIPYVIIIGPEEIKENVYKLKDMRTGEQTTLSDEDIVRILKI